MIQSINHVTYSVSNIKSSIEFYKNILKTKILLLLYLIYENDFT